MLHRSNTAISLEKPRLNMSLLMDSSRSEVGLPRVKTAILNSLSRNDLPKTAPTDASFTTKQQPDESNEIRKSANTQKKSEYLQDLKNRNNYRTNLIKQWAFKTLTNSELGVETTPPEKIRETAPPPLPPTSSEGDKIRVVLKDNEVKVNLAELDDDVDFMNGFQLKNRNPALNISKEHSKKSQEARCLDEKLILLSKDRFKKIDLFEYQKKLFVDKQLKKAKNLPGLK